MHKHFIKCLLQKEGREFKEVSHQEAAAILLEGEMVRTLGGSFLGSKTVVGKFSKGCQRVIKPELSVNGVPCDLGSKHGPSFVPGQATGVISQLFSVLSIFVRSEETPGSQQLF